MFSGTGKFKNKKRKPSDDVHCRQVLVAAPSMKFTSNISLSGFALMRLDGRADGQAYTMRQLVFRDDFLLMRPMN